MFYTQIYNSSPQYGIYLTPIDAVCHDQSLCPYSFGGHVFSDMECWAMAATLYEKLSWTDVIPTTYNKVHNIISHYVDLNDGYLILWEMMEDEHPGMQKDPIYPPPNSTECDGDLQEYTNHFMNWLPFECLNHWHYKDEEQVLHYLKGLHYKLEPAI